MILLALGSNLKSSFGDRFKNIDLAVSALKEHDIKVKKKSSYYESFSYPNKKDPKFINIIVNVESHLSPQDLASVLIFIEESLERERRKKNDPRTCDIDIVDYKGKVMNFIYKDMNFTVPHKKLTFRNFVLFPLYEVSPNWRHPKTKELISTLIENIPDDEKNSILKVKKS
tara:strand:+ start:271 stop:783 length:513 start_codon:yes stop_codon:yes gene_type:complete